MKLPKISTMTMRAGEGIPGSILKWNLEKQLKDFQIVVFDGDLNEEAKQYYKQFDNIQVVDMPWDDKYHLRYQRFLDEFLNEEEYGIWLDDDETLSDDLIQHIKETEFIDSVYLLPCILHLTEDGINYYASENEPFREYAGQWTKPIFIKKTEDVYVNHVGSHVQFRSKSNNYSYIPYPYLHFKSLESFILNDILQAYVSPEGQHYNLLQANKFRLLTKQYKNSLEFKEATKNGTWSVGLQKFAWDYRWFVNFPISRLAWTYWILYNHPRLEVDEKLNWNEVKKYVLSEHTMDLFEKNKKSNKVVRIERK